VNRPSQWSFCCGSSCTARTPGTSSIPRRSSPRRWGSTAPRTLASGRPSGAVVSEFDKIVAGVDARPRPREGATFSLVGRHPRADLLERFLPVYREGVREACSQRLGSAPRSAAIVLRPSAVSPTRLGRRGVTSECDLWGASRAAEESRESAAALVLAPREELRAERLGASASGTGAPAASSSSQQ
jgi:hypothetical protein